MTKLAALKAKLLKNPDVRAGYEAADAETMRRIQREAGAQFERIWVGDVIE